MSLLFGLDRAECQQGTNICHPLSLQLGLDLPTQHITSHNLETTYAESPTPRHFALELVGVIVRNSAQLLAAALYYTTHVGRALLGCVNFM